MKINRLDAHDRYTYFTNQNFDISECCQNLINQQPFGDYPFYIFAHSRTIGLDERFKLFNSGKYKNLEEVPEKTIIWQPRLTKPKAQENSMLFRAIPGSDNIVIIWIIPRRELWDQFEKDKMTQNGIIYESIWAFKFDKCKLEEKGPEDLPDEIINKIYQEIGREGRNKKNK